MSGEQNESPTAWSMVISLWTTPRRSTFSAKAPLSDSLSFSFSAFRSLTLSSRNFAESLPLPAR